MRSKLAAMIASGSISVLAGVSFVVMASGPGASLTALAGYALLGGVFFLVSALLGLAGLALLLLGSRPLALAGIACCGLGFANVWPLVFSLTVESRPERSGALSGLMCMAIFGGAVMPALMGVLADRGGVLLAFTVPLLSFAYLAFLAVASRRPPAAGTAG